MRLRRQLRFVLFLVVALLVATQGALVHAVSHAAEFVQGSAAGHDDGDAPKHACDLCMAFSAIAVAAVGGGAVAFDPPTEARPVDDWRYPCLPRAPPAFRSQAPPVLS